MASYSPSLLTLLARRSVNLVTSTRTFATAAPSSTRFPPPPPPSTQPSSFDFRRLHQKKSWVPKEEDPDYFLLFEESLGRDYKINWAANYYQISPRDQAFRNLHVRGLQMLINGRDKATGASHVSFPSVKQEQYVVGLKDGEGKTVTVGKAVTEDQFKVLFREVRKHLSDVDNLFIHDGRIGAEKVRAFTDNAGVALALKNLLLPTPLGKPGEFQHGLTVYIVSSIEASTLGDVGLGENFTLVDAEKNNLFIVGNPSTQALRTGLSQWYSYSQRASGLILSADVLVSGQRQLLVLSQDNGFLKSLHQSTSQHLVAGNNVLWNQDGLSPLWKGTTFAGQASHGDLVENKGLITKELKPQNLSGHPTTIVFFGENLKVSEGVSKLSAKQAVNNFNELLKSQFIFGQEASQLSTRFEELLTQSKTEIVLFNKKGADADVAAKFKSLL